MLFNSGEFCFLFLPATLALFYAAAHWHLTRLAIWILGIASAFFYVYATPIVPGPWGVPVPPYLLLLAGSIVGNYAIGASLRRNPHRWFLAFGVAANLSVLGYFKYWNFFINNLNTLAGADIVWPHIFLPLGISFYTFQSIAYLADCNEGKVGRHSMLDFAVFLHFFPQLIAGPIVHHREMLPQFRSLRTFVVNHRNLATGFALFTIGLAKKVLIADHFSGWVNEHFQHVDRLSPEQAWAAVISFGFQIYFDFSGYSDMAIGLGLLFNVRYPQNFNSPYKSESLIDFWRRWHMTLSRFLRDYVYIPLGGNRRGKSRRYVNLLVTMLLGGFWHGAAWTYVIWGAWHGFFLAVNHAWEERGWKLPRLVARLLTLLVVFIGWAFFRSHGFQESWTLVSTMLGGPHLGHDWPVETELVWLALITPVVLYAPNSLEIVSRMRPTRVWACAIVILFVVTAYHFDQTTEFLYYQF
ncbi:MAG: MBOAT family protein [Methylacidiphilales bacterium]|nr:MBOAT family protein [Candidatus Methylacidiphilales bacterium]